MRPTIIFGGYGFIGNQLYKKIKKHKYRFTNLNQNKYSLNFFLKIIKKYNPKNIFFLSGIPYPSISENKHLLDIKENNIKIQNLLEAAKINNFLGKIIYASSIAVYGSNNKKKVKESDLLNPESHYAVSKINAENQCMYYANKFTLNVVVLRLSSVFGPGLNRQVIYEIIKRTKRNPNTKLMMDGSQNDKREFLFIDDLIKILLAIMNKKISSGIYNIGTSRQIYIKNIIKYVQKKLKSNFPVIFLKKKTSPNFSILSTKKIKKIIKYRIKNNFYENLNRTIKYFEGTRKRFD